VAGELVVAAIGVRPDVRLAELAGLDMGPSGGIAVDYHGCTSVPDIYAVGDAVEKADWVSGDPSLIALANIANRQGRRVADRICGRSVRPMASLGTAIVRVFGLTAAMTGWNETRLRAAGRRYRAVHSHPMSHAGYYPGAEPMALQLLFDPEDGTILGAQAVGGTGVDKRIDVLATAMAAGLGAMDLADLELAYAPPFSSAKDPVNMLGYMAENVLLGECDVIDAGEVGAAMDQGWTLLDVRTEEEHDRGAIPGSLSAPLDVLRDRIDAGQLGGGPFVVCCEVGQRGHTATALLHELGYEARNLDGGYRTWRAADAARSRDAERVVALRGSA
jgi:rhodanese-related sulfurtransferase